MPFDPTSAQPDSGTPSVGGNSFDPTSATPDSTTSESLGFYKGAMHPLDNAAAGAKWLANKVPVPFTGGMGLGDAVDAVGKAIGLPSTEDATAQHGQYIAGQEAKGEQPGKLGEFAGEVAGTLPMMEAGPVAGGAMAGAALTDRSTPLGVLSDMALGAAGGKLADVGVQALSRVAAPAATAVKNAARRVVGAPLQPAGAAAQARGYVSDLMSTGQKTIPDLTQASTDAMGKPITSAEAIGRPGMAALTALGRRQGSTADAASGLLSERAAGAPDRILGDYAASSGIDPNAAQGDIDTLVDNGRSTAAPLYDTALANPDPVWNDSLANIAKRPVVKTAIQNAAEDVLNSGDDPSIYGLPAKSGDDASNMTAQAWDLVKKRLGKSVERDAFGRIIPDSASPGNYNINLANRTLTAQLRKVVPGYSDALDASGDYLSLQNAFQNGQKFILNPQVTAQQVSDHIAGLSDAEVNAFRGGVANKLFDQAQNGRLKPGIFNRPILQQKMSTVIGPDNASQFLQKMQIENSMAKSGARMAPGTNSVTSDVANATNEQDGFGAMMNGVYAGAHAVSGNHGAAVGHIVSGLQKLGAFGATGGMPVAVRDEAGRLLMMDPGDLASHLSDMASQPDGMEKITNLLSTLKTPARIAAPALAVNADPGPSQ